MTKRTFRSLAEAQPGEGVYACPTGPNFGAVDSFAMVGGVLYGFQMTVSLRHPIKQRLLVSILKHFAPKQLRLVFVVPHDCFDDFGAQSYLSAQDTIIQDEAQIDSSVAKVEQWVLKVSLVAGR